MVELPDWVHQRAADGLQSAMWTAASARATAGRLATAWPGLQAARRRARWRPAPGQWVPKDSRRGGTRAGTPAAGRCRAVMLPQDAARVGNVATPPQVKVAVSEQIARRRFSACSQRWPARGAGTGRAGRQPLWAAGGGGSDRHSSGVERTGTQHRRGSDTSACMSAWSSTDANRTRARCSGGTEP